jgi:FixJ family two-component response regulator
VLPVFLFLSGRQIHLRFKVNNFSVTQIALLAARGLTNRQIATEAGLSINTVSNHLKRVYAKLEVSSRTKLAWRLQYVEISRNEEAKSPLNGH